MNKEEAKSIIAAELEKYRSQQYEELIKIINESIAYEITTSGGICYQIEIQAFWDNKPNRNIRVMGSIDDGGIRAFVPLCDDFIKSPSGDFIGE